MNSFGSIIIVAPVILILLTLMVSLTNDQNYEKIDIVE